MRHGFAALLLLLGGCRYAWEGDFEAREKEARAEQNAKQTQRWAVVTSFAAPFDTRAPEDRFAPLEARSRTFLVDSVTGETWIWSASGTTEGWLPAGRIIQKTAVRPAADPLLPGVAFD